MLSVLFFSGEREVEKDPMTCSLLQNSKSTPAPLPGKSHGRESLVGCSPWGRKSQTRLSEFSFNFTFMHWRRKWQPTPMTLPGESQGRVSLVGCRLWGLTESDMTEVT